LGVATQATVKQLPCRPDQIMDMDMDDHLPVVASHS
jgi:hypothetical protein